MNGNNGHEQIPLTRRGAAEKLRISVITVDRMIASGLLRATRVGRRVLVSAADVDKLLAPICSTE